MTLSPQDLARINAALAETPRAPEAPPSEPPKHWARWLRRDRLDFEGALTERERFESMGVPYDEAP